MAEGYKVNSQESLDNYLMFVKQLFQDKKYVTFNYKLGKPRTIKQNSSMWKFCQQIAERCNDAGYEMQTTSPVLSKTIETPWTDRSVMDNIWMPVQRAMYPNKSESSSELDTYEVSPVAETVIRFLGEKYKIHVAFPSKDFKDGN